MLKDTLTRLDVTAFTTAGLVLFFIVFIAVTVYAFSRTPPQAREWSRIPLTDDAPEEDQQASNQ